MSVFQVKLNNTAQGLLDKDVNGVQFTTSHQRSVYIMGPNKIMRLLKDGDSFTDCNYWKRFAYPQVSLDKAFINVTTDDGSIYSDVASENTFPKVYDVTAVAGTTYTDAANIVDIAGDTGGFAVFAQITNNGLDPIKVKLNGLATAIFDLAASASQVFNTGDLSISLIAIDNSASGVADADVQIVLSVRSVCNS
jgi:hypothetical protein